MNPGYSCRGAVLPLARPCDCPTTQYSSACGVRPPPQQTPNTRPTGVPAGKVRPPHAHPAAAAEGAATTESHRRNLYSTTNSMVSMPQLALSCGSNYSLPTLNATKRPAVRRSAPSPSPSSTPLSWTPTSPRRGARVVSTPSCRSDTGGPPRDWRGSRSSDR